jgi:hypothetical protein
VNPSVRESAEVALSEFDRQFGVDTVGRIHIKDMDVSASDRVNCAGYQGTPPQVFHEVLNVLKIKHEDFVFIDFGSGKGITLLLASELPFKRIIGVEFSPSLHQIAEENIRRYKSATQKCKQLMSVGMDALAFPIPRDPLVVYLFNPFSDKLMSKLLANIEQSSLDHPREVFIVYCNPSESRLLTKYRLRKAGFAGSSGGFAVEYGVYQVSGDQGRV